MSATLEFLESVLPVEGNFWYVAAIFETRNGRTRVNHLWHRTRLQLAACLVEADENGATAYHACAVFSERAGGRKGSNAAGACCLWSDIDAGPGKQYPDADTAHREICAWCDRHGIPRPLAVRSGHGLHCYWTFGRLLDADTWKKYALGLAKLLTADGIKHERTTDLASILRPVGTTNRKREPVPVTVLDWGYDCNLEDLGGLLDVSVPGTRPHGRINSGTTAEKLAALNSGGPRYSARPLKECGQLASPPRNADGHVPEPVWHLGLGVFAFIEGDGDDAAHEWSSDDERYDEAETQARLDRVRATTSGATTCAALHAQNPETCEACPHWQKITSPIALCREAKAAPRPASNGLDLPDLPEPYEWRGNKLCLVHETNNGKEVESVISEHPIYLAAVLKTEMMSDYTYLFRQHTPATGWLDIVIAPPTLYSGSGHGEICRKGASPSDWSGFLGYTRAAVSMMLHDPNEQPTSYDQFGWKDNDTSFLYGAELFTPTQVVPAILDRSISRRIGDKRQAWIGPSRGSLQVWTQTANLLFSAGTEAQSVALCASFGAPLQKFLSHNEGGSILSMVTRDTGQGKTTAQAAGISVWGKKRGLALENIDSSISRGATIAALGNLPLFFDQFDTTDPYVTRDFVEVFTNGRDKRRMGRDGKPADPGLEWQTTLITASNASLVDSIETSGNVALATRIFEMSTEVPDHLRAELNGERLKIILDENSGLAGAVFLAKIMANLAQVRHEIERWHKHIEQQSGLGTEGRFWIRLAATVAVAAEVVTAQGLLNFYPSRIMEWLMRQVNERRENADAIRNKDWAIEALGEFLGESNANSLVVNGPFFPGQIGGEVHVKPTRELFIRKERQGGKIYISKAALKKWCVEKAVNMRELLDKLVREDVLTNRNKNVTLGAGTDFSGTRVQCIEIEGYHSKLGHTWKGESATVLPFSQREPEFPDEQQEIPY